MLGARPVGRPVSAQTVVLMPLKVEGKRSFLRGREVFGGAIAVGVGIWLLLLLWCGWVGECEAHSLELGIADWSLDWSCSSSAQACDLRRHLHVGVYVDVLANKVLIATFRPSSHVRRRCGRRRESIANVTQ